MTRDSSALITLVVPAYNEGASLPHVLPPLLAACEQHDWELIVVDDGSRDDTPAVLAHHAHHPRLTVLTHKLNRGYGGALKTGIRAARTPYIATVDADGQHRTDDVAAMLDVAQRTAADLVVGNRGSASSGWYRDSGKALIRWFAARLMTSPVRDLNSGLKLYDRTLVQHYLPLCPDQMAFSDIITLVFISQRHRVVEHPIHVAPRRAGTSTIGVGTALDTVREILNMVVLFNPTRIFWPLALLCILAGLVWGLPIVLRGGGVSVGAMLAFTIGALLFFLGLVAEQISLVRRGRVLHASLVADASPQLDSEHHTA
jgi:glycosyltransferase involved in cell wall biosynthesis